MNTRNKITDSYRGVRRLLTKGIDDRRIEVCTLKPLNANLGITAPGHSEKLG
jgi:hypothetical protein